MHERSVVSVYVNEGELVADQRNNATRHSQGRHARASQASARSTGSHFKQPGAASKAQGSTRSYTSSASRASRTATHGAAARAHHHGVRRVQPRYSARRRKKVSAVPIIVAGIVVLIVISATVAFAVPAISSLFSESEESTVEAGIEVEITIPTGASGDQIASILSENHIIEDPQEYYATVRSMNADTQLKPGNYIFTTLQDPEEVVQQLIDGPNADNATLTIQEGLTVEQTAERVEEVYGISADEFLEQAKASNYSDDYPFLEGAYDDSLEGYLYPKTYTFSDTPTADEIIRTLLDQFVKETADLDLEDGANGLTMQEIIALASLIERETAVDDERALVASVIYNRLDANMLLQIDAAIVYARGGGSDTVTYDDLAIDSPYNVYLYTGLTPGPICSPSISSIEAALNPADTDYLYYVLSADGDGTHEFSETYEEFLENQQAYQDSLS